METVTYICVYNNKAQLDDMLCGSLRKLNGGQLRTLLLIDNTQGQYKSCAAAYNRALAEHDTGDVLVFLHQDIAFDDDAFERRIIAELRRDPNQILGFAGMPVAGRTVSNLRYLRTRQLITATQLAEKTAVESVDECCFALTRGLYDKMHFDERTCDHWHLYAVDLCYAARRAFGTAVSVLPESLYHKYDGTSGLTTDRHFLRAVWKMTRKYRRDFAVIYTPCYIIPTAPLPALLRMARTMMRNALRTLRRAK